MRVLDLATDIVIAESRESHLIVNIVTPRFITDGGLTFRQPRNNARSCGGFVQVLDPFQKKTVDILY